MAEENDNATTDAEDNSPVDSSPEATGTATEAGEQASADASGGNSDAIDNAEADANGQILTDEEKNALVEGVESGQIEVHSSAGPTYASVMPFRIPSRAHIVKHGYPRLKVINQQVAERIGREVEQLLQNEVVVRPTEHVVQSYGRVCENLNDSIAAIVFEAAPLQGRGLVVIDSTMVRLLVDTFYGGDGEESEIQSELSLTVGELSVTNRFALIVLGAIKESWAPLQEVSPERVTTEVSIDLVDIVTESDPVISTGFDISLLNQECHFQVLLPIEMLQPLLPIFAGQKGDRDPVEDARWSKVIQSRLADSKISISSNIILPEMTVRELVALVPGDVIQIDDPRDATVMANNSLLLSGRLGVHRGHNAIETVAWVDPLQAEIMETRI